MFGEGRKEFSYSSIKLTFFYFVYFFGCLPLLVLKMTDFMSLFKYYKRKQPPPDLAKVVDIETTSNVVRKVEKLENLQPLFGLKNTKEWTGFELVNHPGLIILKDVFTSCGQKYWISRCLKNFTRKPNRLNLDSLGLLKEHEEWWEVCCSGTDADRKQQLLRKLRWATIGYHHDWDTKVYSETNRSSMPRDLSVLCSYFAEVLGFTNFTAQAGIINMYHMNSTLSGHTDHSEMNLSAPLFSFSFGQSAVFLIGGQELDITPTAFWLHSGDVCVMSNESRLCYHGVPRIYQAPTKPWNSVDGSEILDSHIPSCFDRSLVNELHNDLFWSPYEHYINENRLNLNIRQVLLPGVEFLPS